LTLSWIQDIFQKLRRPDEEQMDKEEIHNRHDDSYFSNMKKETSKDFGAKISFQYPKGQFRFPVIPDEGKSQKREEIRDRAQKRQPEEKRTEFTSLVPIKKEKVHSNKEPIQKKRMVGPFRPTEIPSPIYGFQRPVLEQTEIVEHELSHFSDHNLYDNHDEISEKTETAKVLEIEFEPQDNPEQEEWLEERLEKSTELDFEDHSISITNDEEEIMEHPAELVAEQMVTTYNETAVTILEEAPGEVDSELEKPRKPHLPFNVIMLKQDKQKWEQKKARLDEENSISELSTKIVSEERKPIIDTPGIGSTEHIETTESRVVETIIKEESIPQTISIEKIYSPVFVETEQNQPHSSIDPYELPSFHLLKPPVSETMDSNWVMEQEELLNQTLENFNVGASVVNVTQGPSVTRFEVQPEPGVKVNKVTNLTDDIKLSLAAKDIRIEAPIPGKHTIGIEVPNLKSRPVLISEIIQSGVFLEATSPLTAVLGLDISGKPIVTDLKKMPHGLIAGATGSGKSVCINSILISLLYKASPEDLKLLLIDPKVVELAPYNHIPHLISPVITDVKAATAALKWAVDEMERRYQLFAHTGVRDINRFNDLAMEHKRYSEKLPFIVIVIDELADLMMMSPADVEEAICRIAQKARACGIHLIIATQRPSVDVITGLIKANVPTRISFSVSSQVDSRTIIDIGGAEKLLCRGDMLFLENGSSKPVRLQGTFVSDEEIDFVVAHIRDQREPDYIFEQEELLKKAQVIEEEDELFYEACEFVVDQASASTSSLQRRFKIGYNRAARLMDLMEQNGYISGANGSKPREVLINEMDLESMQTH
jgi:DNA segregation ATPase FtsK/SpoIIIE, S-DNA-T family